MISPPREMEIIQRMRQLDRCMLIIALLAPLRRGALPEDLLQDVENILGGRYAKRTIVRDLAALSRLGLVERFRPTDRENGRRLQPFMWRFRDRSVRAAVLQKVAELRGELRDAG